MVLTPYGRFERINAINEPMNGLSYTSRNLGLEWGGGGGGEGEHGGV